MEIKAGQEILIRAKVIRQTGKRIDAQTADGQLIQTDLVNCRPLEKKAIRDAPENKAIKNAPENKGMKR